MTCTKSPEDEESPVPSLFMDLLLNDEDENDLDWLDAEAPGADLLPTSPLHMSPDGPHAHTRLRHLGHGQTPPHSPVKPSEIQFVHSLLPGEVCIAGIDMPSHVPEFPEASGLPCHRNLNPPLELHCFHGESTAEAGTLQQPKFSHSQLRQLYAQVQAHAQLLLQSFLLASQGQISVAVARDVEKLWGWSDSLLKSGPLREEQVRMLQMYCVLAYFLVSASNLFASLVLQVCNGCVYMATPWSSRGILLFGPDQTFLLDVRFALFLYGSGAASYHDFFSGSNLVYRGATT